MDAVRFPISVVVLAKNEAAGIRRCLESLNWCDEVVVVDDDSTDDTAQLALNHGARVVSHCFESFAKQRNWALENAQLRHDWALMLDADEAITPELKSQIEQQLPNAAIDVAAYKMCRKTILMGRWLRYSDGFPVWIVRLVRVGHFQFQDSGHGEVPVPQCAGRLGTLPVPFLHYPFDKGFANWIERHNKYSTREAEHELRESTETHWPGLWTRDRAQRRRCLRNMSRQLPCRALLRFLYQYVIKGGVLDGQAGLTFSWLMAVYEGFIALKRREMELTRNFTARDAKSHQ
jgi:glycosyltransferase involved in cell wall biosynthesis